MSMPFTATHTLYLCNYTVQYLCLLLADGYVTIICIVDLFRVIFLLILTKHWFYTVLFGGSFAISLI